MKKQTNKGNTLLVIMIVTVLVVIINGSIYNFYFKTGEESENDTGEVANWQKGQVSAKNSLIHNYLNQIKMEAELFHSKNNYGYENLCKENNISLLLKEMEKDTSVTCKSTDDSYCISVEKLASELYYCLDSEGNFSDSNKQPCGAYYCF